MALPNLGFPLAAASATAAEFLLDTGGVHARQGRLAFTAVLSAFLFGALWLASARSIAGAVGHCLAVEGFGLDDDECKVSIQWSLCMAGLSLMLILAIWYGEARAAADQAGGGARQRRPDLDQLDTIYFLILYNYCAVMLAMGKMTQRSGARDLLQDPANEEAARTFKIGRIYYNAGFLAFSVVHCCFSIPYVLLRLMWFLRGQFVGSKSA